MASAHKIEIGIDSPRDLVYIECSLPPGLTIAEYQRLRPRRQPFWKRFKH
jgi:hypothetical protein